MEELKRYYTYEEVAIMLNSSYPTITQLVRSFSVNHIKNNGRQCIRYEDIEYLRNCKELQKQSRMNYSFARKLSKKIINQLIERL